MQTEFFFYYTPGQFPSHIVNTAHEINSNFEMESYLLDHGSPSKTQDKWTLKIRYPELTNDQTSELVEVFQTYEEYDGFGAEEE